MLYQACLQVLVQGGVDFHGQNWVDSMGPGSDGALPSETEISKGVREQEAKLVLDLKKRQGNRKKHHPAVLLGKGPAWAVKVESNRAQL